MPPRRKVTDQEDLLRHLPTAFRAAIEVGWKRQTNDGIDQKFVIIDE